MRIEWVFGMRQFTLAQIAALDGYSWVTRPGYADGYPVFWMRPDGNLCGLHKLLFHWTVHVDLDWSGYKHRYCYRTDAAAIAAMDEWSGALGTEPDGWHKHPDTGRLQHDTHCEFEHGSPSYWFAKMRGYRYGHEA